MIRLEKHDDISNKISHGIGKELDCKPISFIKFLET